MTPIKRISLSIKKCELCFLRFMSIDNLFGEVSISKSLRKSSPDVYKRLREIVITYQRQGNLGHDIQLTAMEDNANERIMTQKIKEYKKGLLDPSKFAPGHHIFEVLKKIKKSSLFGMLKKMPKGGVLHAHDTALCTTEFLIQLTYREHLWICTTDEGCKMIGFRFSKEQPQDKAMEDCCWQKMAEFREWCGEDNVRTYLLRRFSMYPLTRFKSNNEAWVHFMSIFILLDGLLLYAPVWGDYYYNALKEFNADGVQYLELRSLLPKLYNIDGKTLEIRDTVDIYKKTLERFMRDHKEFIGSKLIYAPLRGVDPPVVADYVETCTALNKEFPDFLIGFDLVGQEEMGRPLIDFVEQLLKMPPHINFYFHAGETNWFGSSIDENLIDAILLGTKRIGHGYAITKHPFLMNLVKFLGIAIEVCPVSNQVLQLGQDYRNHPAASLISRNVPMIISSDDPSFWRATPLSHDFYFAFLGIAPMNADLKFLKRLAKNSIKYSALTDEEKSVAFHKWKKQWTQWIEDIVNNKDENIKK